MYVINLLRWLRGYVRFTARSGSAERFMNLCAHHGIGIWRCCRTGGRLTGYTTIYGYRRMHRLARKADVCTRVSERHGLPFMIRRYRKRIGIAVGILLFAVILIGSQQFIWVVRVEGCEKLEPRMLVNALEELGVRRGVPKRRVDTRVVQRELTLMVDGLSWAALNVQGTTATLLVRERTPPPPKIDTGVPANVVAAQDGQIIRMEVTDGRAVLKAGDTVRAGELIVSGVSEDKWGLTHLLRANARVTAHVPESMEVRVPLNRETARLTGEIVRRRYIEAFGARLPLFIYSGLEGEYKAERVKSAPTVFGVTMPFEITRETYVFFTRGQERVSEETALRMAEKQLARGEKQRWGDAVLSSEYAASVEDGVLILRGKYVVEADIAKQVEIPVFDRAAQEKKKKAREGGY